MPRKEKTSRTALPEAVTTALAEGDFDAIEELWLARLEDDERSGPPDVVFFAAFARAMGKAGAAETARFLLELLDEQLTEKEHWRERLDLLRRTGGLLADIEDLHPAILGTLEKIYGHLPSYEHFVDKVGLHRAVEDLPKTWKKVERVQGLLLFDVGSIVHMQGKGAGRVLEVNMALESFNVRFETGMELRVGFGGAAKLLEPLPPDHVLYRKLEEPEVLERLRDEQPSELLRAVLESYAEPLTGAEIKRILAGVVPEDKWYRWWSAARKHPQVVAAPGGRRAYDWAASSADAHDAIWEAFEDADPRTRIDLLRRDGDRDPRLRSRMVEALSESAASMADTEPGLACEIWLNLERSEDSPADADWSPRALLAELEDPRPLFDGIRDRAARARAYEIAREEREDWPELYLQRLWQEQDPRALDFLHEGLAEASPDRFERFFDQILSQPRKNPAAFTWVAERAAERQEWLLRNPIRLLKQLFWALTHDDFLPFRAARLIPLTEPGGTVPILLAGLDEEQAEQAYGAIGRATGLRAYQRQPLLNAILARFPALSREVEAPLYATSDMIEAKREELKRLTEVEIPANRRAIEEARELGDLRENFEYKSARQRHEYLAARAAGLSRDLARVRPIDPAHVRGEEVIIGSRVRLASADAGERTITILGPWNSRPERDILSNESELAKSLLGLSLGESVELGGVGYRIESIEPYE